MNLHKKREFVTEDHGANVTLQGDGSKCPCLCIDNQWVSSADLRQIAKQLKKWADKLDAHESES